MGKKMVFGSIENSIPVEEREKIHLLFQENECASKVTGDNLFATK